MTAKTQTDSSTAYVTHCQECEGMCAAAVFEPKESRRGGLALFLGGEALEGAAIDRIPVAQVRETRFGHAEGCSKPRARDDDETVLSLEIHEDNEAEPFNLGDYRDEEGDLDRWQLETDLGETVFDWLKNADPGAVMILHAKGKP